MPSAGSWSTKEEAKQAFKDLLKDKVPGAMGGHGHGGLWPWGLVPLTRASVAGRRFQCIVGAGHEDDHQ